MCNRTGTSEALTQPFGLTDHFDTTSVCWFQEDEYIDSPWEFGSRLTAFTSRDLSYQSDALSAFRGVLNTSVHSSYWGIPLLARAVAGNPATPSYSALTDVSFAVGLSWSTTYNVAHDEYGFSTQDEAAALDPRRERKDFPSWSWSSCRTYKSPLRYQLPGGQRVEYKSDIQSFSDPANIKIFCVCEGLDGCISELNSVNAPRWDSKKLQVPERSKFLQITTNVFALRLQEIGDEKDHWCVRYCVQLPSSESTSTYRPQLSRNADGPDLVTTDGLFLVDLDKPASKHKDNVKELKHWQHTTFLGLVIFRRQSLFPQIRIEVQNGRMTQVNEVRDDEFCIMIVEPCNLVSCPSSFYFVRVGLVWLAAKHMTGFKQDRFTVRLG